MRIAIISDIHGNYIALKAVLEKIKKLGITQIYSLGDVAGYYSQINECCDALRHMQIPNLMGNHDWYLSSGGFCPRSSSINDCLDYQRQIITSQNLEWIQSSTLQFRIGKLHMVHGGWTDPIDEYIRDPSEDYFNKISGEVFISGHTHIQGIYRFGSKIYCNPGSVGQPRDGNTKAAFAVFEEGSFTLHRVEYNINKVIELMQKAGFSERYYNRLLIGK